jgi:hypothetical protein
LADDDPLLALYHRSRGSSAGRAEAIARYAFAVLDPPAADAIVAWAPSGLVEVGAGAGYWARLLAKRGLTVAAYDRDPPPSPANPWFAGVDPWFEVVAGDERKAAAHPDRCLLLVWPTKNETWAADAVRLFHQAGGQRMVYVGEPVGGRTGDDLFHALIGGLDRCYRCAYDLADSMCVCDAPQLFQPASRVPIPNWAGFEDSVVLLHRSEPARRRTARPRRWRRGVRQ